MTFSHQRAEYLSRVCNRNTLGKLYTDYTLYIVIDTTPNTAIAPVQTFEGTNVNETSPTGLEHNKHPGYTPMSALPLKQLQLKHSSYANMSD